MNPGNDSGIKVENMDELIYIQNLEKILLEEELSDNTRDTLQIAIRKFKQSVEFLKRRNAELVESEQKFKAFAQLGHWEWDLSTNKMELSEEAQKIYQLNKNSVNLSVVMDMIHSEDKTKVQEAIDRTIKYYETVPVECRIITPKGIEKWLRADEHAIIGESGDVEKVFGYIMDITERKNTEIQLRENEEKFRLLIENLGEGIGIVDTEENFSFSNQVADEFFGVPQGELVNRNLAEFVNQETLQFIKEQTQIRRIGKKSTYEIEIIQPSGEKRQIIVSATPQFNKKGNFSGTFGVIVDITEQKQIENALLESEERLRSFMDSATDAFTLLDSEFKFIEINQTALDTIGLERPEVINKYYGELIPNFEESETFFNYMKVLRSGNPIIMDDYIPHSKFGEKYFNVKIFRVGDGLGIIATDLTERKRMEEELLEKRKLAALGQMAAGLAHELNTPLANINLTTDYLLNLVDIGEPRFKDNLLMIDELNDIKQQANFCVQIIKDLLLFSRKIDISASSFNAKSFFSEITSSPTIGMSIKEKNIDILFEIHEDVIMVGDQVLLSQCFQNIINNSIDAFSPFHDNPMIKISLEELNKGVEVCIKDNGEGIKGEHITKVFEPFFTTKKVGYGTGLGLSIARGIVERHNGHISVVSTRGEGTEVKVILPK